MAVLLALLAAFGFGLADFLGGLASKVQSVWQVTTVVQISAGVCALMVGLATGGTPGTADWVAAACAGFGGGLGCAFLYRGLSTGRMGLVAPISAIGSAVLPVMAGVLTGDRLSVIVFGGVAVAIPSVYLISKTDGGDSGSSDGVVDGVLAGLGFGVLFISLAQVDSTAGLLPLALTQLTAVIAVGAAATVLGERWWPRCGRVWRAAAIGPLGSASTMAFLVAAQLGMLSIVSTIAGLYPAWTVLLARLVLHERIHRWQAVGLGLAGTSIVLVAIG